MSGIDKLETWVVRAPGVARQANRLSAFLAGEARFVFVPPGLPAPRSATGLAGWGAKGGARAEARRLGRPYLALEDGFLRGANAWGPSWSLSLDRTGAHYDAASPSDLERSIQDWRTIPDRLLAEAEALIALMRASGVGKYNDAPDLDEEHPLAKGPPLIVVADQVRGDRSIAGGGCDAATFSRMLQSAVEENPGCTVVARVHPNRKLGRRGHLRELAGAMGVPVLDQPLNWMSLAGRARRVYTATSLAGIEALIAGSAVTCFGIPFYAGWGRTDDRQVCVRRTARPPLAAVVAAAYGLHSRYLDPISGRPTSALAFARLLARRRAHDRETAGVSHVLGVPGWKRPAVRPFLEGGRTDLRFAPTADAALRAQAQAGGRIIAWASKAEPDLQARCAAQDAPLTRLEDGFLRSVGLGAAMTPPLSLVLDHGGIYYDPSQPSQLETALETTDFDAATLSEAADLRAVIVEQGLSKYNVGGAVADPFAEAGARRRVLVPGQVEDDASVRLGGARVRDNRGLLEAARAHRPNAFIVYKPHPDVEAGLRPGKLSHAEVLRHADGVALDTAMPTLLALCDELRTLTSLSGFEALLRGVTVATYGRPFYGGWGLTEDEADFPRRTRRLSLDQLTAGVLLLYPRYVDPRSGWPCSALRAAELLAARRAEPEGVGDRLSLRVRRALARAANARSLRAAQTESTPETARAKA